jgi:hypothetical protein
VLGLHEHQQQHATGSISSNAVTIRLSVDPDTRTPSLMYPPPQVSVYEEDEEALEIWRDVVGVHPSRIRKMGAADNFWASGPTGVITCKGGGGGCHSCGRRVLYRSTAWCCGA